MEDDKFLEMMSDAGFDLDATREDTEKAERDTIRREIFDTIDRNHMASSIAYGGLESAQRLATYFMDLQDTWFLRVGLEAAKTGEELTDDAIERIADARAEEDMNKYHGFQKKIVNGIEEITYQIRTGEVQGVTLAKNFYLALAMTEFGVELDDPQAQGFIDLFDFMVPGELLDPNDPQCRNNLIVAKMIDEAPDAPTDTKTVE